MLIQGEVLQSGSLSEIGLHVVGQLLTQFLLHLAIEIVLLRKSGCQFFRVWTLGKSDAVFPVSKRDVDEDLIFFLIVLDCLAFFIFFNELFILSNFCFSFLNIRFYFSLLSRLILCKWFFNWNFTLDRCSLGSRLLLWITNSASLVAENHRFERVGVWILGPLNRVDFTIKLESLELFGHCMQLLPLWSLLCVLGLPVINFRFES